MVQYYIRVEQPKKYNTLPMVGILGTPIEPLYTDCEGALFVGVRAMIGSTQKRFAHFLFHTTDIEFIVMMIR